jgi:hypothetical protein
MAIFEIHTNAINLKEEEIASRWNQTIVGAAGQGEKFYTKVEQYINGAGMPDVVVGRKEVDAFKPSQIAKKANHRVFLSVNGEKALLNDNEILIGARDFGKNLLVCRYIVAKKYSRSDFSVLDNEEREAYFSLVHSAVLAATEEFMKELNLDTSKINRVSKGIIDIV